MLKIIGTMSGTSCDGIDVALIETDGESKLKLKGGMVIPYESSFSTVLKNIYKENDYKKVIKLEKALTEYHANAIKRFLNTNDINASEIDLIGFHGHTVFHNPGEGLTWQIGNANLLAELTGRLVASDFRRRDIAAGGQGAPLVPVFHQALARSLGLNNTIFLNIGGVSNITYIDKEEIIAFDAGPGNAIIDDFLYKRAAISYDEGGKIGVRGKVDFEVVRTFQKDVFYNSSIPKSLDRNHFNYIDLNFANLEDGAATLTYITADFIKKSFKILNREVKQIIVCGGGRKNKFLMGLLEEVKQIDEYSVDGDLIEAYAFGYLAARTVKKLPISYPTTTGVKTPKSGGTLVL